MAAVHSASACLYFFRLFSYLFFTYEYSRSEQESVYCLKGNSNSFLKKEIHSLTGPFTIAVNAKVDDIHFCKHFFGIPIFSKDHLEDPPVRFWKKDLLS